MLYITCNSENVSEIVQPVRYRTPVEIRNYLILRTLVLWHIYCTDVYNISI